MKKAKGMGRFQNVKESHDIALLFQKLNELPLPTIALIHGKVYGGGVGLTAASDFAIADKKAVFCLSEGRLGMVSAVMMPYLRDKMDGGFLKWAILSGKTFGAEEALRSGLIQKIVNREEWSEALREELSELFKVAPGAQKEFKKLYSSLRTGAKKPNLISLLARHRTSSEAWEGILAFEERRPPAWNCKEFKIPKLF
jgi:methylglutaconyl-CoA hydratase